jgi:fused
VRNTDDATSSRDSIKAILQSDIEVFETDAEENVPNIDLQDTPLEEIKLDYSDRPDLLEDADAPLARLPLQTDKSNICFVSGNSNLMVQRFNDNFPQLTTSLNQNIVISDESEHLSTDKEMKRKINELEKRKLSQNTEPRSGEEATTLKKSVWNSDDAHSAPIENEEWLAFLHKSMQEILGEWERIYGILNVITRIFQKFQTANWNRWASTTSSALLWHRCAMHGPAVKLWRASPNC